MAKKIIATGKTARRIEVTDRPARRIAPEAFAEAIGAEPIRIHIVNPPKPPLDPAEVAEGLGARPCGERIEGNLDPIGLAELGAQLLARLRSSGGRPALADATEICRVPLSAEDLKTLEGMISRLEESSGVKPSVGQLVSVIVRAHLQALNAAPGPEAAADPVGQEPGPSDSKAILQQMIDEQIRPLREQVRRLEAELHAVR